MATGDVCGVGLEENDDDDETIRRPQLCEEGELIDCMPSPTDTLPPSTNSKRGGHNFEVATTLGWPQLWGSHNFGVNTTLGPWNLGLAQSNNIITPQSTAKFCSGHTGRKTSWEEKQRVEFLWLQPVPG
ncbi:hypothetical protein M0802_003504 [Mischocyttarus mexicanus]|nr:hypothetical protein M0802_003504 [Mischocyttarus mexicanus]